LFVPGNIRRFVLCLWLHKIKFNWEQMVANLIGVNPGVKVLSLVVKN
jgi:hypothetical protein